MTFCGERTIGLDSTLNVFIIDKKEDNHSVRGRWRSMLCNAKICEELIFRGVNFIGRYVVRHGRLLFLLAYCIWGLKQQHFPFLLQRSHSSCDKETKIKVLPAIEWISKNKGQKWAIEWFFKLNILGPRPFFQSVILFGFGIPCSVVLSFTLKKPGRSPNEFFLSPLSEILHSWRIGKST